MLVPVLTTILKLSPSEVAILQKSIQSKHKIYRGTVSRLDRKEFFLLGDFVCFYFLLLDIAKADVFLFAEPQNFASDKS